MKKTTEFQQLKSKGKNSQESSKKIQQTRIIFSKTHLKDLIFKDPINI